ncbi:MAG: UPF0175 family protein [Tepidisphaeraceae bacterium]|jgi:predicted HTH domain antitoxin
MAVSISLPSDIEQSLRLRLGDLDQEGKEAMLIELYRRDKITRHELTRALNISRLETEAVLKKHNVTEDLPTKAEMAQDVESLRRLLEKS